MSAANCKLSIHKLLSSYIASLTRVGERKSEEGRDEGGLVRLEYVEPVTG